MPMDYNENVKYSKSNEMFLITSDLEEVVVTGTKINNKKMRREFRGFYPWKKNKRIDRTRTKERPERQRNTRRD